MNGPSPPAPPPEGEGSVESRSSDFHSNGLTHVRAGSGAWPLIPVPYWSSSSSATRRARTASASRRSSGSVSAQPRQASVMETP